MPTRRAKLPKKNKTLKNKTFSISNPYIKPNPKRKNPFQNILPVYEKLIDYGLPKDKMVMSMGTHIRYNLPNDVQLSIIYLYDRANDKYWLETMIMNVKHITKKQCKQITNIDENHIGDVVRYKTIKQLYNTIIQLEKILQRKDCQ